MASGLRRDWDSCGIRRRRTTVAGLLTGLRCKENQSCETYTEPSTPCCLPFGRYHTSHSIRSQVAENEDTLLLFTQRVELLSLSIPALEVTLEWIHPGLPGAEVRA